jgi:hypothetical protein
LLNGIKSVTGYAGDTGTLARSLEAIAAQCEPQVVVVRVEEAATDAETTSNIIGGSDAGRYTGIQAFRAARGDLGVVPRILGAPGLDSLPVTNELLVFAKANRGMVYANCDGAEDAVAAVAYRDNFSARELMLIWPDFVRWDRRNSAYANCDATAIALGTRAAIDRDYGWHKTISNIGVNGVEGISKNVDWDLQSITTDAGYLNQNEVTTLINHMGRRFWGSRTCSDDSRYAFESAVRTNHVLAETIAEGMFWAVDRPIHRDLVKDIIESVQEKFRELKGAKRIIGATCWYDPERNSETTLSAGKLCLSYDFTPCPPAEDIEFVQTITSEYFADFATTINGGTA